MKRILYEDILKYVNESKYHTQLLTVKEEYENAQHMKSNNQKLKFKCGICDKEYMTTFSNFKTTQKQCKECGSLNRKKKRSMSYDEIKKYIEITSNSSCRLKTSKVEFEERKASQDKPSSLVIIDIICSKCKLHTYSTCYKTFKKYKNYICKECMKEHQSQKYRKTTTQFEEEVYNLVGDEYIVLGEYMTNHDKVLMKHICGNEYYTKPNTFLNGSRCPKCQHRSYKKTQEEFENEVYNLVKDEYTILSMYKTNNTKVTFKHINESCDNYVFKMTPNNFIHSGQRCPKCFGILKLTNGDFIKKVKDAVGDEYTPMEKYINSSSKIIIKHNLCGNSWSIAPSTFLYGTRCPICNESKGEQKIRHYFEDKNINFKSQVTFDDLLSPKGYNLRYDFGIYKDNNLVYLVEFDGKQHFELQNGLQTPDDFSRLKIHDNIKNNYCHNKNIKLLRIAYTDILNIENILDNLMNEVNYFL